MRIFFMSPSLSNRLLSLVCKSGATLAIVGKPRSEWIISFSIYHRRAETIDLSNLVGIPPYEFVILQTKTLFLRESFSLWASFLDFFYLLNFILIISFPSQSLITDPVLLFRHKYLFRVKVTVIIIFDLVV